ncbi:MAG: glycosyltransferase family 4 protein [Paracoccaceae bacterium]
MRIAIIGTLPPSKGGIETFLTEYTQELVARGHAVMIICDTTKIGTEDRCGVIVNGVSMSETLTVAQKESDLTAWSAAIARIQYLLVDFEPDVIHVHPSGPELLTLRLALKPLAQIPIVLTLHSGRVAAFLPNNWTQITTLSTVSNTVKTACDYNGMKIHVIENALPLAATPPPFPTQPRICAMGRVVEEKGFDVLLEAFSLVRTAVPEALLTLGGLGPELEKLKNRADIILDDPSAFETPGWLDSEGKRQVFSQSQAVVVPSRWEEPFGLIALEAAQHARAAVVSRRGELSEIVRDGETGIVVADGDIAAFADALTKLLRNPADAERMGANAFERVQDRYQFSTMMDRYEQLLRESLFQNGQ